VNDSGDGDELEITIDARRFAGVWANAVRVNGSNDEITIDFARLDPVEPRGIVVSRVTCSPQFLRTLMDELERVWQHWMWGSSPPEMRSP
jgi:hypothetical protein